MSTTTATRRRFDLTPLTVERQTRRGPVQERVTAGVGAVAQHDGGGLPVFTCTCGAEVVWATSSRTGRKYLATVQRGYLGQRYYVGANAHTWDAHDDRVARREADLARMAEHDNAPAIGGYTRGEFAALSHNEQQRVSYYDVLDTLADGRPYSAALATSLVAVYWDRIEA